MKRFNKKLTIQLTVMGVVAVCGAIAIAQAVPRLRSGAESPDATGAGDDSKVAQASTTPPIDPASVNMERRGIPGPLGESNSPPLSLNEESAYSSTGTSQWENTGANRHASVAAEREMEAPATYSAIPSFDEPPLQPDPPQATLANEGYHDIDDTSRQEGQAVITVAAEADQYASQQPPPFVDSPRASPEFDQPADLEVSSHDLGGPLAAEPLPALDHTQADQGFADLPPFETNEPAPQYQDSHPNFADGPKSGLTHDGFPPLEQQGQGQYEDQPAADLREQDFQPGIPQQNIGAAEPNQEPAYSQAPVLSQDVPARSLLAPTTDGTDSALRGLNQETLNTVSVADTQAAYETTSAPGKPGPVELEGPRTPSLTIEKIAPAEVRVGTTSKFLVKVKNVGQVAADRVVVRDEIPHGTRLISTVPRADQLNDGTLVWQMGTIKPGEEVTATMELAPMEEGQVGSVATVSFQTSASARAVATKPQLEIEQATPRQALVGDDVVFSIRLSNPGTGSATHVILKETVPEGLTHVAGEELEYEVGTLQPGEERQLELTLKADKPGVVHNELVASADANLLVRDAVQIEVVAPQLQVQLDGPARRYLQRPATFAIALENPGTAPAQDIELVAHLPRGLKFVNTNNAGYYDQTSHAVHWNLEELPAGEMGSVQLTVLPIEMGQLKVRADVKAQMGLSHASEKQILVEGLAALLFTVGDVTDPVEVGGQTTYEIRVANQGTKEATNVRLAATVPQGMRAIGGDGPTQVTVGPQQVVFAPLPRLNPQADASFKIHVQGDQPGDKRFRVQVIADDMSQPVTKEESTRVYAD